MIQTRFDFTPKLRHDAPETSRRAAERVEPRAGTQRWRILELLRAQARTAKSYDARPGLTDEEIQMNLAMNPSSVRPRRKELQEQGWIRDSGRTRKTRSGCEAVVWEVVPCG